MDDFEEKTTSIIFRKTLEVLSYFFGLVAVASIITITVKYPNIVLNVFNKNGYDAFYNAYKITWGSSIACIGLLSLYLTLSRLINTDRQLLLMNKQRETSYQPDLMFGESEIAVFSFDQNGFPNERHLAINTMENRRSVHIGAFVDLCNVGLGTAKMIEYSFSYDIKQLAERINEFDNIVKIKFISPEYSSNCIVKMGKTEKVYSVDDELKGDKINYIIPESKAPTKAHIKLPSSYVEFYVFYLSLMLNHIQNTESIKIDTDIELCDNKLINFPELTCTVTYHDMGYVKNKKTFTFDLISLIDTFITVISKSKKPAVTTNYILIKSIHGIHIVGE